MPDQSGNLTALRSDGHHLRAYLSLYSPTLILSGTVSSAPTYAAVALAYTVSSGDFNDVKPGYRVDILTATGAFKGRTRVRFSGSITSTSLPIRELSKGTIEVEANDLIKVYAEVRLSDKLTAADATLAPDGITYTNQTNAHRPLACSGGPWAGFVDSGQSYATVQFTGSASAAQDPDTVSALTHAWTFPAGSAPTSSTAADPSAQIPVGHHLIIHTVTDPDNSTSQTQYIPVIVHDDSALPHECLVESLSATEEQGWTASIQVFADIALTDVSDGTLAILWVEEFIAGTQQTFGPQNTNRTPLKLVGVLRRGEHQSDADLDTLRLTVISPLQVLDELFGTSKVLQEASSPTKWQQFRSLTTKRAIVHIFQFYTTLMEAGYDLIFPSSATYFYDISYTPFYLQQNSPVGMAREIADGVDARIVCDRTGRFLCHTRPELIKETDRSTVTRTLTVQDDDIIEYEFERSHSRPLALYRSRGVVAPTAQPAFSKWPGDAPGLGRETPVQEKMIFTAISDLYERTGLRGAAADGVIWDSDNEVRQVGELDMTLFGPYDLFDFYQEYTQFSVTRTGLRGFDWDSILWTPRNLDIQYEDQTARVRARFKPATLGPPGVDDTPPTIAIAYTPFPAYNLDSLAGNFPFNFNLTSGTGNVLLVLSDGTVAVTTDFDTPASSGGPTWTVYDHSGTIGSTVYAYSYQAAATNVSAWIIAGSTIWHVANLQSASPTFTNQYTSGLSGVNNGNIDSDYINLPGQFAVAIFSSASADEAVRTQNGGSAWLGPVTIGSGAAGGAGPGLAVSPRTAGKAFAGAETGASDKIQVTTDYGASWADYDTDAATAGASSQVLQAYAYQSGELILYQGDPVGSSTNRIFRLIDTGTPAMIEPDVSGTPYGRTERNRFAISIADDDANKVAVCASNAAGSSRSIFITASALAVSPTWTPLITPASGVPYRRCALVNNGQELYAFGPSGAIGYTSTPYIADSIDDRTGDLVTAADVVGIAGF